MPEHQQDMFETDPLANCTLGYVPQHIIDRNMSKAVYPPIPYNKQPLPYAWIIREQDYY